MQRIRHVLAAALCLGVSACAWFGDDKEKMSPLTEFTPSAKAQVAWRASVGKRSDSGFTPLLAGGNVYAAANNGLVSAFQAANGRQLWVRDVKQQLTAGVGLGDDSVYVGTKKGEVIALALDGKELWRSQLPSEILARPQASEDVVLARTGDGGVAGLEKATGQRKWLQQRTNPALILRNMGAVTIASGTAFMGFPGGKLAALNLNSGNVIWEGTVATPRGATELERVADVVAPPVLDRSRICAVAYQGRLSCFDPAKGSLEWYREVSSAAGMAQDEQALYVVDDKGGVLAFAKSGGTSLWKQDKLSGRRPSAPALFGKYVVVGDVEGFVHVLSTADGKFAVRIPTDGKPITAAPAVTDKGVIVQTRNANLFAINIQ
jgi:outer membrane protein assembly factor BamB